MKIFRGIEGYTPQRGTCVTTGTFDGVHLGHRKIIARLTDIADSHALESVLLTFEPHPRRVLFPDQDGPALINTLEEKLELLEQSGIGAVIVHPFTRDFSRTSALVYVRDLLVGRVGMRKLVIGHDHQFGRNREGSIGHLRELAPMLGFEVEEIPAQEVDDVNISSTKIRAALEEGNMDAAKRFLGYRFFVTGTVAEGDKRGRGLGFPTANIAVDSREKIVPARGIYAVEVDVLGKRHRGMASIGVNPTFGAANAQTIEVNIFDFDTDIYGRSIRMYFHQRLRSEKRFDSADELIAQMHEDKRQTLSVLV